MGYARPLLSVVALVALALVMAGTSCLKPAPPVGQAPSPGAMPPPPTGTIQAQETPAKPTETSTASITWLTDYEAALQQAKAEGKPMMIDVFADWCGWCKKLDEETWPDPKVAELAAKFVCVKLDADAHPDLGKQYAPQGLPTVVFLKPTGETITSQVGFAQPEKMLEVMQKALGE